jgi:hypothetical protein
VPVFSIHTTYVLIVPVNMKRCTPTTCSPKATIGAFRRVFVGHDRFTSGGTGRGVEGTRGDGRKGVAGLRRVSIPTC